MGLEPGLSLPLDLSSRLDLFGAVAYDGFQWDRSEESADYLDSLCLGLGAEFRRLIWFGRLRSVSFGLRHDWLDHDTNGGTDLSGNAWTFRFTIGAVLGFDPYVRLAELEDRGW